jgi:hypothetical protein
MAHPLLVADGGRWLPYIEGSNNYIGPAVADSQHGVMFQFVNGWGAKPNTIKI